MLSTTLRLKLTPIFLHTDTLYSHICETVDSCQINNECNTYRQTPHPKIKITGNLTEQGEEIMIEYQFYQQCTDLLWTLFLASHCYAAYAHLSKYSTPNTTRAPSTCMENIFHVFLIKCHFGWSTLSCKDTLHCKYSLHFLFSPYRSWW